ncbi:MAG: DUF4340 domain-containing protein [Anaerovoracaceae bacterium]
MSEKRRQHEIRLILLLTAACLVVYLAAAVMYFAGSGEEEAADAALRMTSTGKSATIVEDGGTWHLEQKENATQWTCMEEPDVALNSTAVSMMVSSLKDLQADRVITDGSEYFDSFGLGDPQYRITVKSPSEEKTWCIGALNVVLGQYYVTEEQEDTVYLVPERQVEKCVKHLTDLVATPGLEDMNSAQIRKYRVKTPEESYTVYKAGENYQYKMEDGTVYDGNSYTAEDIFFALKNTDCSSCVAYHASEADLQAYGLNQPDIVITLILQDDTELVVRVAENEDGTGYLNAWENEVIYHITAKDLENLKEKISLKNQL